MVHEEFDFPSPRRPRWGSNICISCGFGLSVLSVSSLTLLLDRSCLSEEPQSWCLYSEPWAETERMRHLNTSLLRPVSCISLYSHTDCLLDMYIIKVYSRALKNNKNYISGKGKQEWHWMKTIWHIFCLYSYTLFVVHFFFQWHWML